jgi:hypothetical protein
MHPVQVIVTALSLGAEAGLKSTVEAAIKQAYGGLKALVLRKFGKQGNTANALELVGKKPASTPRKKKLHEELTEAGAGKDQEVVDRATDLLKLLESKAPGVTGGLVGQINAAGGKVLVLHGGNQGTINM